MSFLIGVALPVALAAQSYPMMPVANPDADRLAELVRRLGTSPRDLPALIEAGELSFRLGDATAAAAFYKRAEAIDPRNGRVKGGIARILVNGEQPGEALRYFLEAERHGAPMARYADDRGLAYDLIGQQERAQRDYRVALTQGDADDADEVRRRYALSLGISGRQTEALAQIDALLRKSDRGAWRARAFILAMNGDVAGANKIATSMMPAGMAGGLAAFFQRLPTLNATDRAFAVHFGEVSPTPTRLADARMVPPLPA
ncbi:tetratricopeptide repeat protein, partial [Sphingomonas sp.]|uniref:tetratricopeptide repeat protein n=1 Tax=Sphingomonas sp. TaxID=28214 RepID=UPI0035C810AE